ncbi:MAG TPA: XrtA/PEP-CTERM system TPR-repeat protein PrsT [Thiobacillus sp.]|nr:XrtA/PEP-CTERM system TPR-repeat protein PrsT [Thiobacillus sp.]
MTKHPFALAIALAFATSAALSGCDRTSNLTEQEHIQRAKDFEDKGNLKGGIIELKNAIQKNPDSAQARLLLGQIYLKLGQGNEAEKELSRAEKLGVNPESIKLQLGRAWLLMGEYKRVLEDISPTGSTSPRNKATILQMQGDALLGLRKLEEGCKLYKDSLTADSRHVPAYWGLANCAIAKRNMSEARSMIDTALKIDGTDPESWVVLADFERLNDNHQAALEAYSTALKHDPSKLAALFGRAQLYAFTGKPAEAKADLERLKKLSPSFYGIPFVEATLHYAAGETDQALDAVQHTLKSNPNYLPGQLLFALVQYDRKSYENAAKALEHYLQRAPGHLDARKLLAATYIKLNQPDRSLALLKPYIASGKADAQVLALAGEAHLRGDDPNSARDLFKKAADLVPASATLRTRVGLSQLVAGQEGEAVKELEASSAMGDGKDYRADVTLTYHFLAEGQFDKALAAIATLEKKLPNSPGTYNLKGQAYMGKKDFAQARKNFERALELDPTLVSAAARLAMMDQQEKNLPAARGRYLAILDKDSKSIPAMVGMAELAALEKKEQEYLGWLEKAAKISPAAFVPRALLAQYYLAKGNQEKALAVAREAVAGNSDSPEAQELLGRVQLAAGEKDNALATYTKLTTMVPKSAPAQYNLAKAHAAMGDVKATRSALRKALELKPDYVEAVTSLTSLEARTGNHSEALRLARELQKFDPASPTGLILEGDAWMAAKAYAQAAQIYEKVLEKNKDSVLVVKRHEALLRSGDARKAEDSLLSWLKSYPQDQIVRAYLAESYIKRKLNRQAIEQYQTLLRAVPDNATLLNNLANLYQEEKDPRALATAEKAYKLQADNPAFADTLGWVLVKQGDPKRGLPLLEKAAARAPKQPEIRYHLAYALAKSGDVTRARSEVQQLQKMKLGPDLEQQVHNLLQSIQ